MKYIPKDVINDKLCIHCKLHVDDSRHEDGHGCLLVKNYVDGSALNSCSLNRRTCGGDKWVIADDIVVCNTKDECDKLAYEYEVNVCIPYAMDMVKNGGFTSISNGYLEEAIRRVKAKDMLTDHPYACAILFGK